MIENPIIKKIYGYSSIAEVVRAALVYKIKELENEIERTLNLSKP